MGVVRTGVNDETSRGGRVGAVVLLVGRVGTVLVVSGVFRACWRCC